MKILSLNPFITYTKYINKAQQPTYQTQSPAMVKDIVSFSGKKVKEITDLREIPHVICACCGDETIPNSEIDDFLEKRIFYQSEESLKILRQAGYLSEKHREPISKEALTFCEAYSLFYPDESLTSILKKENVKKVLKVYDNEFIDEIKKIEKMTRSLYHNSEYMVKELEYFEPRMHQTEKEVFNILKKESQKHPQKTFTEILTSPRIKDINLKNLEIKQSNVFCEIEEIASKMSPESLKKVTRTIKKAKAMFDLPQSKLENKRSYVIESFENLSDSVKEKEMMQQIMNKVYNLPSSKTDASSFIIKYSQYNPDEIAEKLLRGSVSTHEHVKPKKRENDNGENDISNYIVLCSNCNSERARTPYANFIKFHTDMPENLQRYLDIVIKYINKGILKGFDDYPLKIKNAVETESEKKIILNYSKLDLLAAKNNKNN